MISRVAFLTRMPGRDHVAQDRLLISRVKEDPEGPAVHVLELHRMWKDTDASEVKEFMEVLFVEITDERAVAGLRDHLIAYCKECQIK